MAIRVSAALIKLRRDAGRRILLLITLFCPLTLHSKLNFNAWGKQESLLSCLYSFLEGSRAWLTSAGRKKFTFRKIKTFHINKYSDISEVLKGYTDIFADEDLKSSKYLCFSFFKWNTTSLKPDSCSVLKFIYKFIKDKHKETYHRHTVCNSLNNLRQKENKFHKKTGQIKVQSEGSARPPASRPRV